jgi:hypothetical protein
MKELTLGDHASVFKGPGFHFVGIRDWEPGDRPVVDRLGAVVAHELQPAHRARVRAGQQRRHRGRGRRLDVHALRRHGATIETAIARAVAAVGLSAVFFQDMFGLVTFDDRFEQLAAARPRIGRSHVIYCVDLYRNRARSTCRAACATSPPPSKGSCGDRRSCR